MLTFVLLSVLVIILWVRVNSMPNGIRRDKRENYYTTLIIAIIIILAAFRSEETGADTPGYMREYGEIARLTWQQITERFNGYSTYYYLSKVFRELHMPLFVWFAFVEFVYLYAIKLFIGKYSTDKILSLILFISMGLFTFSLAGLKQVMAMALMLYAFYLFSEKKYIITIILIVLAYLSHNTSLIFLFVFPLYYLRDKKIFWPVVITAIIVLAFYGGLFLLGAADMYERETGNEHFSTYLDFENNHSPVMLIYYISLIIFCIPGLLAYKRKDSGQMRLALGVCMIASASQILAFYSPHAFRFAYYFLPFYMVLVPNSHSSMTGPIKKVMGFVIVVSVIFYFLYVNRAFVYSMDFII